MILYKFLVKKIDQCKFIDLNLVKQKMFSLNWTLEKVKSNKQFSQNIFLFFAINTVNFLKVSFNIIVVVFIIFTSYSVSPVSLSYNHFLFINFITVSFIIIKFWSSSNLTIEQILRAHPQNSQLVRAPQSFENQWTNILSLILKIHVKHQLSSLTITSLLL